MNKSFAQKTNQNMSLKKCRIQYAYRLDPVDLAWGYIMGVQTEVWSPRRRIVKRKGFCTRHG